MHFLVMFDTGIEHLFDFGQQAQRLPRFNAAKVQAEQLINRSVGNFRSSLIGHDTLTGMAVVGQHPDGGCFEDSCG